MVAVGWIPSQSGGGHVNIGDISITAEAKRGRTQLRATRKHLNNAITTMNGNFCCAAEVVSTLYYLIVCKCNAGVILLKVYKYF